MASAADDKMFKTGSSGSANIEGVQITSMRPRLIVPDPDQSIDFYRRALGAELEERYVQDGIVVHAGLSIGSCAFSIAAEVVDWGLLAPTTLGGSAMLVTIEVDDARAVAERMVDSGAHVLVPVEDRPYGRCEGRIQDPFGHLWIPTHAVAEAVEPGGVEPKPVLGIRRIVADLTVADTSASVEFFRQLLDLDPMMDFGWIATLTPEGHPLPQLTLMTDDAMAPLNPQVSIEVDDLDLVWRRAQDSGAEIVYQRTIEPWGVERFFVRDPSGNVLNILTHVDEASTGK